MIIKNAKFITSAVDKKGFIHPDRPLIAICGKSNVGKSSLINALANRKGLARTSVTPGRTRLVNYFDFGEFVLADLPGYGFAKVSQTEKQKWGKMLEDFFASSKITHVFSLVDIRHDPTKDDVQMINYLHHYALSFSVIATKSDKIGKTRIYDRVKSIGNFLAIGEKSVMAVSSETGYGKDKILQKLDDILAIYNDDFFNKVEETEE
ncbi:MAG: YihA family ribosome biogenesis GTP-binding protein [Clostridia bacterium]|nr:YihA family ribosome biogenesis GTP-binding protein [Clostridia bacterium]